MSAPPVALIVLACSFGGALLGMRLSRILPAHHLGTASKDTVMVTMGLVGSMTALVQIWPESSSKAGRADDRVRPPSQLNEGLADRIAALTPATDSQRALQARAVELSERLLEQRWLVVSQTEAPVPSAFLVILVFWLTVAFGSYGLFAPTNGTVTVALFLGSVSVAAALFLVLELGSPFDGGVKVSGEPMRRAIVLLDR